MNAQESFRDSFWRTGNKLAAMKGRNVAVYSNSAGHKSIARALFMGDIINVSIKKLLPHSTILKRNKTVFKSLYNTLYCNTLTTL